MKYEVIAFLMAEILVSQNPVETGKARWRKGTPVIITLCVASVELKRIHVSGFYTLLRFLARNITCLAHALFDAENRKTLLRYAEINSAGR
jgi:hypothetical protein